MSMREQFDVLVKDLAEDQLEELRECVTGEIGGRRKKTSVRIEDIHPRMTGEERERAARDIARILDSHSGR